ncbi:MAG: phosphotransferase [Clostridia bacterium]|nr:phosphotransferase [Clostridia bacterium]
MFEIPKDLPGLETYVKIEPITEGLSPDHKFYVETAGGTPFLLRIDDVLRTDRVGYGTRLTNRAFRAGVPMQKTVRVGVCGDNKYLYHLLTWIPGDRLDTVIEKLPEARQYELGVAAGEMMKTIDGIETYKASSWWNSIVGRLANNYIAAYKNSGKAREKDALLLEYIEKCRPLWAHRPMCFTHGDFHLGNFVLSTDEKLYVIDFDRHGEFDPYWSFKSAAYNAMLSPKFVTGQIHGYFDGEPPEDFWPLFASYMAVMAIDAPPEARDEIMSWFDDMRHIKPRWYTA